MLTRRTDQPGDTDSIAIVLTSLVTNRRSRRTRPRTVRETPFVRWPSKAVETGQPTAFQSHPRPSQRQNQTPISRWTRRHPPQRSQALLRNRVLVLLRFSVLARFAGLRLFLALRLFFSLRRLVILGRLLTEMIGQQFTTNLGDDT